MEASFVTWVEDTELTECELAKIPQTQQLQPWALQDSQGGYHSQPKGNVRYSTHVKLELALTLAPSICHEITDNLEDECLTHFSCI